MSSSSKVIQPLQGAKPISGISAISAGVRVHQRAAAAAAASTPTTMSSGESGWCSASHKASIARTSEHSRLAHCAGRRGIFVIIINAFMAGR